MSFGAYFSGALTHLFFTNPKTDLAPIANAVTGKPDLDLLMPHFLLTYVPHWLVLVILLMVFSASMSSLSSLVLVSSSAVAIDIYGAFVNRHANPKRTMLLLRLLCAAFVGCSLLIALQEPAYIVNLMVMSWGTLLGVFLAPYLLGLFWKRTTAAGVYAGMIVALVNEITLISIWGQNGAPLAGAITMVLPLIVVPVVSLMTRPPEAALIKQAFEAQPAAKPEKVGV
jgi:Na+/proline symporter